MIISQGIDMIIHNILLTIAEAFADITPLIPYYHMVSNERLVHICHLYPYKSERQFIDDVDFLCTRYQPISLGDLIDFAKYGKKLKKGSFIITFDDGYSQIYSVVAPILFKKGIPAIFFLASNFIDNRDLSHSNKASIIVEYLLKNHDNLLGIKPTILGMLNVTSEQLAKRILTIGHKEANVLDEIAALIGIDFKEYLLNEQPYLTSSQIRKLIEMGFYFGAHSMSHPYFKDLSIQDQLRQTIGSLQLIRNNYGLAYSIFAFPHDDYFIDKEFFHHIENIIDLTFGTCGIKKDPIVTNLQRINFERTLRPASHILIRQLTKKIVCRRSNNMNIPRTILN